METRKKHKHYLSFGAGVNSTALLILLIDRAEKFESIFVDHGGDYPETYAYLDYLKESGFKIEKIKPKPFSGCVTIEEYILKYRFFPSRIRRWCTQAFKVIPFLENIEHPSTVYLGLSLEEQHRAINRPKKHPLERDVDYEFPLIEAKMDRKDCVNLIKQKGLIVPNRSTCYFCPFQTKLQVRELFLNHPDLFKKLVDMEQLCSKGGRYYIRARPTTEIAMSNIPALTSYL